MTPEERFRYAVEVVLRHEGGYVNDPHDPGGETKYGISKRCLPGDARVLTLDLRWVPLSSIRVGDVLMGFDEIPERRGKLNIRRFRPAIVEAISKVRVPASKIVTDRRTLIASNDHLWLRRWGKKRIFEWCPTSQLLEPRGKWTNGVTVRIATLCNPWEKDNSYEAGYLAGLLDGEGHVHRSVVGFTQRENEALVEALRCAEALGLSFKKETKRAGVSSYRLVSNGEPYHYLSVLGRLGAKRLLAKAARQLLGRNVASTRARHDVVVAVEPVGTQELIAITTSTRTLIVEGLLSHNSYPSLDIANLTREDAIAIYRRDWWERYRMGEIQDADVAAKVLDLAVNTGPVYAAMIVQRALHACGRRDVEIDGIIGSQTLAAINSVHPRAALLAAIKAEAAAYYRLLVERRPELRRFEQGWITRAYS